MSMVPYRIFASYLPKEESIALPILDSLEAKGHIVMRHHDITGFCSLPTFIRIQLASCDVFLAFISGDYSQSALYSEEPLLAQRLGKRTIAILPDTSYEASTLARTAKASPMYDYSQTRDVEKAVDVILSNSHPEDTTAQLARAHLRIGVKMYRRCRYEDAVMLFKKAAQDGNKEALYHLGKCTLRGHGTRQDEKKGFRYIYDSAKGGVADAQYHVAIFLLEGKCCDKNAEEAAYFLRMAADCNHAASMTLLGKLYYKGIGVSADKEYATSLFEKAAANGEMEAIDILEKLKNGEE